MVDLALVHPGGGRRIYQGLSDDLSAIEPPLWARLIAGYCLDRGWSVKIIDAEAEALPPDEVAAAALDARLVAIVAYGHQPSASTQSMATITELTDALHRNGAMVIAVGGHVAALARRTMEEESTDFACNGEGLETIHRLLGGDPLSAVPGLLWRDGEVFENPPAPLADVADLHGRAWDLLPSLGHYRAHNWQCLDGSPRSPYASVYTSLQCPFRCAFCCINAPFGGAGYRTREPGEVVAEIEYLAHAHGVRTFKLVDEMFVLKPSHYAPICEGLAALPFAEDLNLWAYARVDTVRPDRLALLRRAGIRWLALGIESGSAYVRDGALKSLEEADIVNTVRAIQAAGINVIGNFIFGLPDDTAESMQQTLALALALRCEFANFYSAMAYPGSALFRDADPGDLPAAWSGYSQHSADCRPLPTRTLTSADVLRFRDAAHGRYFSDPRYLEFVDRRFGGRAVEMCRSIATPLHRDLLAGAA